MKILVTLFLFVLLSCCALHRDRNITPVKDFYGSDLYQFDLVRLNSKFPKILNKQVVYKDSYLGNFTLYFEPQVIKNGMVVVPQITCYSAFLDFPENEYENHLNHVRCRYYEVHKFYAGNPSNFYQIEGGVDRTLARKIALTWYSANTGDKYIDSISESSAGIYVYISGGACSNSEKVRVTDNGSIKFVEPDSEAIIICS